MNRPAHAQQRTGRLRLQDALFELVHRVPPPPWPEPIPVGEARELQVPGLAELVKRRAS